MTSGVYTRNDETKNKIRKRRTSQKWSTAIKEKISKSETVTKKKISMSRPDKKNCNGYYKSSRFADLRYKARRKGATGSHTLDEWERLKAQYDWICPCCGIREPKIKLTEDHIIALFLGGSDNIENIQPLCRVCNSKKRIKSTKF